MHLDILTQTERAINVKYFQTTVLRAIASSPLKISKHMKAVLLLPLYENFVKLLCVL